MKNTVLLKDLSENAIDKVLVNDDLKGAWLDWGLVISNCESWGFTFTNYDNSSNTPGEYCSC